MKLLLNETNLIGKWIIDNENVKKDEVSERIEWLTENYLKKIGHDKSGWSTLFFDNNYSKYWELYYPNSQMHGGGPPALKLITREEAITKFNIKEDNFIP